MKRLKFIAVAALVLFGMHSVQGQTLLVGYDMDSNTGTSVGSAALDISGHATQLNGQIQASSTLTVDATRPFSSPGNLVLSTGTIGLGLFGPDDPRLDTGTSGLTYVGWVKTSSTASFQAVMGRGSSATRVFHQNGAYNLAISNGENAPGAFQFADVTTATWNDGMWHHIAVVFDPTNPSDPRLIGYVDGAVSLNLAADNGTGNLSNGKITGLLGVGNGFDVAGRSEDNGDRFPNALLDEVAMFAGPLGAADIAALANGSKTLADFAIPEPTSLCLFGSAILAMLLKRGQR